MTKLLTLSLIIAMLGSASSVLASGRIVLRHEAIVPSAQVMLSDVAELESVSRAQRDKLEMLSLVSMGQEQARRISRDVVLIRMDQAGFDLSHFDVVGADATDVLIAQVETAADTVKEVVVPKADVAKNTQVVPVGLTDEPGVLAPGAEASSTIAISRVAPEPRQKKQTQAATKQGIEPLYRVVVLRRSVPRGHVFRKGDLSYIPSHTMPVGAFSDVNEVVGSTALRAMDRNAMVGNKYIGRLDVVKYESVRVMVEGNGFVIEGMGKALEGGMVGETINVLNLNSRKAFKARVSAAGVVHAQL